VVYNLKFTLKILRLQTRSLNIKIDTNLQRRLQEKTVLGYVIVNPKLNSYMLNTHAFTGPEVDTDNLLVQCKWQLP
jgi:hypothetical protein